MSRAGRGGRIIRVTTRNAQFQQWSALLTNRTKRQRSRTFVIQGVRPVTMATRSGWPLDTLLYRGGWELSSWARTILDGSRARTVEVDATLLRELGQQESETPEILAIGDMLDDDLGRLPANPGMLVVAFDRPTSPGNVGTLLRATDALGGSGLVTTGHAADVYDPKCVRASTGSLFSTPAVRLESARSLLEWVARCREKGVSVQVIGLDERGALPLHEADLAGPTVLVIGNEKAGLSAVWRDACDQLARIPIGGSASSLNAAAAGTVALYEAARQRGFAA